MDGVQLIKFDMDQFRGTCELEAESPDMLKSAATRNFVLREAQARGLSRAGLSGEPDVYPITPDGKVIEPLSQQRVATMRYRGIYKVAGGI